jgi:hypothetical protein
MGRGVRFISPSMNRNNAWLGGERLNPATV